MKTENISTMAMLSRSVQVGSEDKPEKKEEHEKVTLKPLTEEEREALQKQLEEIEKGWEDGPLY